MSETQSTTPAAEQVADAPSPIPNPAASSENSPTRWNYGPVAFYTVVGVIMGLYTLLAFDMEWTTHGGDRMGAGFFPRIIGIGGVGLALTGVLTNLRSAAAPQRNQGESGGKHPVLLAVIGLGLAGFVTVFIPVGAPLTATAFLLFVYLLIERKRIARRAILSVAFPMFLFVAFELWLNSGLPGGITDFL